MSTKRLVMAIVVCYIVQLGTNYLIHGVWLMRDYLAAAASLRPLPAVMHKIWFMWVGQAFFVAFFCYIYTRGVEAKPWVAQGVRYGLVMTLFTVIPFALGAYVVFDIPHMLAVKWMIGGGVQLVILGWIVAGIWRKQAA